MLFTRATQLAAFLDLCISSSTRPTPIGRSGIVARSITPHLASVASPAAGAPGAPWAPVTMNCRKNRGTVFYCSLDVHCIWEKSCVYLTLSESSLGHGSLLQKSIWTSFPSHCLPLYSGEGLAQSRVLCLVPPPQETLQAPQLNQDDHFPSTAKQCRLHDYKNASVYLHLKYHICMLLFCSISNTLKAQILKSQSYLPNGN